ncbi:hypothetical protein OIU76_013843 [Salix suchowensis]|nr:hypothetical protein OIU76_013843 [Salix suchowensis]
MSPFSADGCPGKIRPYKSPFCCSEMEPRVKKSESPSSRCKKSRTYCSSKHKQASLSKTKPAKAQHKSTSPASGAAARPQLLSRAGYDQALSANEPVKTTNQPEPSGRTDPPPAKVSEALDTSPTNNSRHKPEAITKTDVNGKNERGKVKDPDF